MYNMYLSYPIENVREFIDSIKDTGEESLSSMYEKYNNMNYRHRHGYEFFRSLIEYNKTEEGRIYINEFLNDIKD